MARAAEIPSSFKERRAVSATIDHQCFWKVIDRLKYTKIVNGVFSLLVRDGGFSSDDFPGMKMEPEAAEALVKDLVFGGYMGINETSDRHTTAMIYNRKLALRGKSEIQYRLYMVFWKLRSATTYMLPSKQLLERMYPVVKRYPVLNPLYRTYQFVAFPIKKLRSGMAKADFDKGEYQWVAEITNVIVFADPTNEAARLLCADALEQLGYQAESGPWRNAYLTAALELRHGNQALNAAQSKGGGIVMQMTPAMIFDYMGILMDKEALADQDFTINVMLSDLKQQHVLHVKNGVLLVYENTHREDADVSITCPKNALLYILQGNVRALDAVPMEGNVELITLFTQSMNQVPVQGTVPFNIIEP